jgi:hypothetical protein
LTLISRPDERIGTDADQRCPWAVMARKLASMVPTAAWTFRRAFALQ